MVGAIEGVAIQVAMPEAPVGDDDVSPIGELDLAVPGVRHKPFEVLPVVLEILALGQQKHNATVRVEPPPAQPQALGCALQGGACAIQPGDELDS